MKKKMILSKAFIVSLLPMLLNQYGGMKGVSEVTGLINLFNPIGMIAVILFFIGVWMPFNRNFIGNFLGALGTIGIVVSEIFQFFTWHVMFITGEIDFQLSLRLAFPEFYFGLMVSVVMVVVYFILDKRISDEPVPESMK